MPSQRKRIGFLPRSEVQTIIDKICEYNKLSQSKVTGILVEEALCSRGVLKGSINKISLDFSCYNNNSILISNHIVDSEINNTYDNDHLDQSIMKDEVEMINDYIEFKFFKSVMNKNKNKKK